MSSFSESLGLSIKGHLKIIDETSNKTLLDKENAIHPQNMARIIARKLANEDNSVFYRLAFGNGGTFIDAGQNVNTRTPNDGNNGAGWEARLYREIYSEIVDNSDPNFGTDPGSAGPDNIRVGGKAVPSGDPEGLGVFSQEVGSESNVIINMTINESEPSDLETFVFDEIGIYSDGAPAVNTSGISSIDIGDNKSSISVISPTLPPSTQYTVRVTIDGVVKNVQIETPTSGTGPSGAFTYGDLCEALNTGSWDRGTTVDSFTDADGAFFFITDTTGGTYPSITGQNSGGLLSVQSKSNGVGSSIVFPEDITAGGDPNLIYHLSNSLWDQANIDTKDGQDAGIINSATSSLERERLLTHLIFEPISKSSSSIIRIIYTVTISAIDCALLVPASTDEIFITPTLTPTPTITPSVTPP